MMEMVYHVTADDTVLGPVERDRAHSEGLLHRSGIVFLKRSDGRVLVQHRSPTKRIFPDCYDCSAAFHVTFGETYEQAAERELLEETGVIAPVHALAKFTHHDPPEYQIVAVFTSSSDVPVRVDQTESAGYEFLTRSEIDKIAREQRVTPWLREGWPQARNRL